MINVGTLHDPDYHLQEVTHDSVAYYMREGEAPGRWAGSGATALGLSGEVTSGPIHDLFEGKNPNTGEYLIPSKGSNRRARDRRGERVVDVKAAAAQLGIKPDRVRDLLGRGTLAGTKRGDGHWEVAQPAIDAYRRGERQPPGGPRPLMPAADGTVSLAQAAETDTNPTRRHRRLAARRQAHRGVPRHRRTLRRVQRAQSAVEQASASPWRRGKAAAVRAAAEDLTAAQQALAHAEAAGQLQLEQAESSARRLHITEVVPIERLRHLEQAIEVRTARLGAELLTHPARWMLDDIAHRLAALDRDGAAIAPAASPPATEPSPPPPTEPGSTHTTSAPNRPGTLRSKPIALIWPVPSSVSDGIAASPSSRPPSSPSSQTATSADRVERAVAVSMPRSRPLRPGRLPRPAPAHRGLDVVATNEHQRLRSVARCERVPGVTAPPSVTHIPL